MDEQYRTAAVNVVGVDRRKVSRNKISFVLRVVLHSKLRTSILSSFLYPLPLCCGLLNFSKYTTTIKPSISASWSLTTSSKSKSGFPHVRYAQPSYFGWTNTIWSSKLDLFYRRELVRIMGSWDRLGKSLRSPHINFLLTKISSQVAKTASL
jgi:hypothetical protein